MAKGHPVSTPEARIAYLRQHPELWQRHWQEVAHALKDAGLFSATTGDHHLRKSVERLIKVVRQMEAA